MIKAAENAEWKLPFSGGEPMNIQWYKDDDLLSPSPYVKIETSCDKSKLRLIKCQRKDSGEVKVKIKNEFGTTEAMSKLIVLGELALAVKFVMDSDFYLLLCYFYKFAQQTNQHRHKGRWRSWKVLLHLLSSNGNHPKIVVDAQSPTIL